MIKRFGKIVLVDVSNIYDSCLVMYFASADCYGRRRKKGN